MARFMLAAAAAAAVLASANARRYNTTSSPVPGKINVHMVMHTHDDVGWLKTENQYYLGANNSIYHAGVQYIIDSVLEQLKRNPDRKFIYVEQAFFQRWVEEADPEDLADMKQLVANGQLEFVNGGWCMHDEASPTYVDMIDQTTLGHRLLKSQFNAVPSSTWQIDPFGHSSVQQSLMTAASGFASVFSGRADYQDRWNRGNQTNLEFIWRTSASQPGLANFAGLIPGYGPPPGLCFDLSCASPTPVQDNPAAEDYNVPFLVNLTVANALAMAPAYKASPDGTVHIMWTMGSDFQHENSNEWFKQVDALIHYVNALESSPVNLFYSTPSIYTASKLAQEGVAFSTTTTDFFPYGSQPHSFWTGYFTSRPALKGYVRDLSSFFTAARQLQALVGGVADLGPANPLYALERAMGVVQHHDAVAGTERQHVAFDYARQMAAGKLRADASVSASLAALTGYADSPFVQCDLANATVCPFLEAGKAAVVLLYNTQGQGKGGAQQQQQQQLDMEHVRLPVGLPPGVTSYAVTGPTGDAVQAQLLPLSPSDLALRAYYGASTVTVAWLAFLAAVPALGHAAYFIEPVGPTGPAGPAAVASDVVVVVQQQPPSTSSSSSSQTDQTLTNGILTLTISAATGMLSSYANAETGLSVPLVQEWFFYNASVGNDVDPQASGAYVFRPNSSTPFPISSSSSPAAVTLVTGPLVSEARITVSPWVVQTVRLWANASYAEVEWTVGPIPMADGLGKEVVTRFSTPLATDRTWVTDSNGREGQVRVRDYRPTWTYQVNEPVAGNFYPVNTWISTSDVTTGERLSVATDRTQAGSSMVDGSLELLVHRRLTADDKKGVAEPLDEPGLDWSGSGLVVRGTHRLALDPARDAPGQLKRSTQDLLFRPLVAYASLGAQTPAQWVAAHTATRTGLTGPLPPNVALVTLHAQGGDNGTVLLRLAHLFEEGEDPVLSQNATVALATLFSAFTITSAVETTLTANQGLGAVKRHVVVALDGGEGGGSESNLTLPVPPYDAKEDGPKGAGLEVTLTPMQIRTFLCATAAAGTAVGMGKTAGRI